MPGATPVLALTCPLLNRCFRVQAVFLNYPAGCARLSGLSRLSTLAAHPTKLAG